MRRTLLLSSLVGLALLWAPPAPAQVQGSATFSTAGTSAEAVDRFLVGLQEDLARDDRAAVAERFEYPLQAWNGERSVKIKSEKQLVKSFDRIFDRGLRATIASASAATAFANWQGVMFDDGRIWLRPGEADEAVDLPDEGEGAPDALRIVTINPPVEALSEAPPARSGGE